MLAKWALSLRSLTAGKGSSQGLLRAKWDLSQRLISVRETGPFPWVCEEFAKRALSPSWLRASGKKRWRKKSLEKKKMRAFSASLSTVSARGLVPQISTRGWGAAIGHFLQVGEAVAKRGACPRVCSRVTKEQPLFSLLGSWRRRALPLVLAGGDGDGAPLAG